MIIDFQKLIVAMEGQDFCMIFRNSVNALELVAMHEFQEALHLKYQKRTHSFRVQIYWPQCRRRWSGIGMSIWDGLAAISGQKSGCGGGLTLPSETCDSDSFRVLLDAFCLPFAFGLSSSATSPRSPVLQMRPFTMGLPARLSKQTKLSVMSWPRSERHQQLIGLEELTSRAIR